MSVAEKEAGPTVLHASTPKPQGDCSSVYDTDIEGAAAQETSNHQLVLLGKDPNVVDWDGDDDPEKALNWPLRKKWTYIILLSTLTLLTYVVSLALNPIAFVLIVSAALLVHLCSPPASH